jgi:signal transduction histidine kinase
MDRPTEAMETRTFTVDSKLLRELGERLVGRPHIALAELVKNSYDADASVVVIRLLHDRIEVIDDGHGMTYGDILHKWLRIGAVHKEREIASPKLGRPLTGSKGVGRLAVQLLANELELHTSAERSDDEEIILDVDWEEAINAGDLTRAPVRINRVKSSATEYPEQSPHGTKIILRELHDNWTAAAFEDLAREIWPLQSPFKGDLDSPGQFRIILDGPYNEIVRRFNQQMQLVLDLWIAKVQGELLPAGTVPPKRPVKVIRPERQESQDLPDYDEQWDTPADFNVADSADSAPDRIVRLTIERHNQKPDTLYYQLDRCHIDQLNFELRVFNLQYRQPSGIRVQEARDYLRRFGGVHIYDTGFHLPYYGPDTDWLHIEIDHSHRLSRSRLLPKELQRPDGMNNLPTNSRLFGTVNVNTAHEHRAVDTIGISLNQALAIQISRDRLTETAAYRDLVVLVRWALDYYSMNVLRRSFERTRTKDKEEGKPSSRIKKAKQVLRDHRNDLPKDTYDDITEELDRALNATEIQEERYEAYLGTLGALATAGVSALAYEHEVSKQFELLENIADMLTSVDLTQADAEEWLSEISSELREWLRRSQNTHALFSYLLHPSNREEKSRFRAKETVEAVLKQIRFLNPGVDIDTDGIPKGLRLPKGTYAEWSAILQNLFVNAFNAMKHSERRRLTVSGGTDAKESWLHIQDTGVGVDVEDSERLFDPFVRDLEAGDRVEDVALGGGGLGLTIVRMTADELGCSVHFVSPSRGNATAVRLAWKGE